MHEPPRRERPDANTRRKSAVAQQLTGLQMSRRVEATQRSRRFSRQTAGEIRGRGPDRQPLEPLVFECFA